MEEGLRTYVEYYNKFRPHMGLHGLTLYEKLKELLGGKTPERFLKSLTIFFLTKS
jgi:hypothetical protein